MNDFDKAGRYLVKRDAAGFFRWLLRRDDAGFHLWIDARRVALPDQGDLTNDLVACFRGGGRLEALIVELQAAAHPRTLLRAFEYLARLWAEPGEDASLPLGSAGVVVVNLTGGGLEPRLLLSPSIAPACELAFSALQHDLRRDDAAELLAGVETSRHSPWLLGWAPLMQGGAEPAIIEAWKVLAEQLPDQRDRSNLREIALIFAGLAGCGDAWQRALRRWNVQTSPYLDEIRAQVREESLEEGIEKGIEKGRVETMHRLILRLGKQHLAKAATKKQQADLARVADLSRLERICDRLMTATSWADLLATP